MRPLAATTASDAATFRRFCYVKLSFSDGCDEQAAKADCPDSREITVGTSAGFDAQDSAADV